MHFRVNLRLLRSGERVYFGINPTNVINGLSFYVNDCLVSDEFNNTFPVIADRCANEFLQPIVESPLAKNLFTMEYTSFAFNSKFLKRKFWLSFIDNFSDAAGDQNQEISCKITVCVDEDCPSETVC